mmetsp:Transcript_11978/g.35692  ORF Transcript_11978/g.35692 Transcript_11978/m.35692 type:complete len:92 (+) Transcript_11978:325-600(+)
MGLRQPHRAVELYDRALKCPDVDAALRANILQCRAKAAATPRPAPDLKEMDREQERVENFYNAVKGVDANGERFAEDIRMDGPQASWPMDL